MEADSSVSISADVRNDLKAARTWRLPWWGLLIEGAICLPVLWLFDHFGRLNLALPTLGAVIALGFLIALKWKLRRQAWFWIVMAVLVAIHAVLLWYVPWREPRGPSGPALSGATFIDLWVLLWIVEAVGRLMEHRATAGR